jgi:hypothetical protein
VYVLLKGPEAFHPPDLFALFAHALSGTLAFSFHIMRVCVPLKLPVGATPILLGSSFHPLHYAYVETDMLTVWLPMSSSRLQGHVQYGVGGLVLLFILGLNLYRRNRTGMGLRGERRKGSRPGAVRSILLFHTVSARPFKRALTVRTFLKVSGDRIQLFVSARTIKRHHC